jgi:hypothetical protein
MWFIHRRLCKVKNMLAFTGILGTYSEHILNSTQAPVVYPVRFIYLKIP